MHEVLRDCVCFVLYVWFCRAMHIETSKILRDDPSYRCSEQNWAFLFWTPFFGVASARKGGTFVLNTHKNHRLRTKLGVFVLNTLLWSRLSTKRGYFCSEHPQKPPPQHKTGGVLCWGVGKGGLSEQNRGCFVLKDKEGALLWQFFVKSWEKICKLRKKVYLCNPIRKRLVWGTDLDHGLIR